jgi:hypothetical protein
MNQASPVVTIHGGRGKKARKARLPVDLWCDVVGARERAVANLRNLSVGGGRFVSPSAFPIGRSITLVLPASASESELVLPAHVRWLALNTEEGLFELGIQFVHSGRSAKHLEHLLKGLMKRTPSAQLVGARSFARFTGGLEPIFEPELSTSVEMRKAFAAVSLDRLVQSKPYSRDL